MRCHLPFHYANCPLFRKVLGLTVCELFTGAKCDPEPRSFSDLAAGILEYVQSSKLTISEFEERAGWEVAGFLESHARAMDWNLDCLMDVCRCCAMDWVALLPINGNESEAGWSRRRTGHAGVAGLSQARNE